MNDVNPNKWKKLSERYKKWMDTIENRGEPLSEDELKLVTALENSISAYENLLKNE